MISWKPPQAFFSVEPPSQAWGTFTAPVPTPPQVLPAFHNDEEKKKAFGIALARIGSNDLNSAFKAGCEVFNEQTGPALWAANHWANDPIVCAARDLYAQQVKTVQKLLDKEELAAKFLYIAEEKIERNGQKFYVNEAKDRIAALKVYAEIAGYAGKINVDASTNNFVNNEMKVTLVKPSNENVKVIEHKLIKTEPEIIDSPIKVRLVK